MSSPDVPPGTRPEGTATEADAARTVREMFSDIAPRYDLLNHLLSLSFDRSWRRRTAGALRERLSQPQARALDLCCGTADLAFELARVSAGEVVACDFAHPMLVRARRKAAARRVTLRLVEGDVLQLPFADGSFDAVAMAFGFRNLANYGKGLEELYRVLKSGGEAGILEFSLPQKGWFARFYRFYFRRVLPWVGRVVSGVRGPYSYLPASVEKFPDCDRFATWMEKTGFKQVSYRLWTGGTVALHRGMKP